MGNRAFCPISPRCFPDASAVTPKIKNSMESFAFETQVRKEHANLLKKEQTAWEKRKQKLQEERLLCKTAAETKANVSQVGLYLVAV